MILLDSHTFIWLAEGDGRLGPDAKLLIRAAYAADALFLSPISVWEIGLKASRGRLEFDRPLRPWLQDALRLSRVRLTPITTEIALTCAELPPEFHGDPADRLIASTARVTANLLLTDDKKLLALARKGYFRAQAT